MEDNKYNEALERAKIELMKDVKRIFPEIIESEDERILEWIIGIVNSCKELSFKDKVKLTRYLEKQKEMPTNEEMLRTLRAEYEKGVADTIAKYEQKEQKPRWEINNPYTDKWMREMIDEKFRELVEQKPAEWSKNDTVFLNEITDFFENKTARLQHNLDMYAHWLKSLPERFNLQPKQEWSEEDDMLIDELESYILYDKEFNDEQKSWRIKKLKSLHPQSRQEWSKEDEQCLQKLMQHIERCCTIYGASQPEWWKWLNLLKSLCPQPHWKPSEEQMEALKETIDFAPDTFKPKCTLVTLQNDLNKLM